MASQDVPDDRRRPHGSADSSATSTTACHVLADRRRPTLRHQHNAPITWDSLLRQTSGGRARCGAFPIGRTARCHPGRLLPKRPMRAPEFYLNTTTSASACALCAPSVAPTAAAGAPRRGDGPDRCVQHLALVQLRHLVDRPRRPAHQSVSGGGHFGSGMFISAWTWRASAISSCVAASGRTARSCRRSGSSSLGRPGRRSNRLRQLVSHADRVTHKRPRRRCASSANGVSMSIDWDHDLLIVVRWIKDRQR